MNNLPQIQLHDNLGGNIPFWVVLTDYDALYGRYAWTEQQFVYGGQDSFTDMVGGRFGTLLANYAWEANQNLAKVGSYALIQRAYWQATEVGGVYAGYTYLIVYTLPVITPDTPVVGFDDNSIVYINNNLFETNTNFQYDVTTNTFTNIGISYFDIDNYTFTVINSDTTIKYIFIDDSVTKVYIWEETLIVNNGYVFIDISTGDQIFQIWNQTDIYFKVDDSTNIISIWNSTIAIDYGNVLIDISFGDQLFQIWNQTDIYFKIDDSTNIISIWNSTVLIDNGSVKIDISTGDQIFYIWNQTDYYIKIDDSTQIINLWGDTIIIEEGDVKIDILVGQLFQIWDQTDIFFKIDQSTGDILIWNSFVQINETYFKFVYSSVTFFWVDASDYSILIGKPGKATSDTTGYVYNYIINGRPTGVPTSKTGYWAWVMDYANGVEWYYDQVNGYWYVPCCFVIVKITFAATPYTAKYNEFIQIDTTGGNVTVDLPAPYLNREITIQKTSSDSNSILLNPISGSVIPSAAISRQYQSQTYYGDGTDWYTSEDTGGGSGGGTPTVTILTSGTAATFNKDATKSWVRITVVGGGGGAGSCNTGASQSAASGGAGGGGVAIWEGPSSALSSSETYTVGGGGAGGAFGGTNNGSNGSDSTFTTTGTGAPGTLTGGGGSASAGCAATATASFSGLGVGGTGSNGLLNISGNDGTPGVILSGTAAWSGSGGAGGQFSASIAGTGSGGGSNGYSYGGGGAGACSVNGGSSMSGGTGAGGVIIVEEFV